MSERLITFTVPPATTLREQDAADLEMLEAALRWREGAGLTGPDELGPLSGPAPIGAMKPQSLNTW